MNGGKWLSKAAVLWALHEAPDVPARLVSTLIAIAAYASEDGRGAYPSAATVAAITRKSETQAKRDLAELEKRGLLAPGDGRIVKDIRADRRPNVYDLAMLRGASGRTPQGRLRGASGGRTGCISLQNGVRPDAPEEVLKTSGIRAPRARAESADASAQPQTPTQYPPCPYCRRQVDWPDEIAELEPTADTEWCQKLLADALRGQLACSNQPCQDASDHCIRCGADLHDSGIMCRDCRVREAAP